MTSISSKYEQTSSSLLKPNHTQSNHEILEFESLVKKRKDAHENGVYDDNKDTINYNEHQTITLFNDELLDYSSFSQKDDSIPIIDNNSYAVTCPINNLLSITELNQAPVTTVNIDELSSNFEKIINSVNKTINNSWQFTLTDKLLDSNLSVNIKKVSDTSLILSCNIDNSRMRTNLNELNDRLIKKGWSVVCDGQSSNYRVELLNNKKY
ncbi:MAG: hypothetical protein ABW157_11530 [Candidatus Thiodiazotropha sp. LLP2]